MQQHEQVMEQMIKQALIYWITVNDLDIALLNVLLETMCCLMMGFLLTWAPFPHWRDTFLALEEDYEHIIFFEILSYWIRIPVLLYLTFLLLKQVLLTSWTP